MRALANAPNGTLTPDLKRSSRNSKCTIPYQNIYRCRQPRVVVRAANDDMLLRQKKEKLEALLSVEGIELASTSQQQVFTTPTMPVDWSRYHLQILFIDRTDTLRARVTAGIFDVIAAWNGFGRAMYTWSCGIETDAAKAPNAQSQPITNDIMTMSDEQLQQELSAAMRNAGMDTTQHSTASTSPLTSTTFRIPPRLSAVLSAAAALNLSLRELVRPVEQFELDDLDRYDTIICLDRHVRDTILQQVDPKYYQYYQEKVVLLTSFNRYECDATVLAKGGLALLPASLSYMIRGTEEGGASDGRDTPSWKAADDIASPEPGVQGEEASRQFLDMVRCIIWCSAGLVKYLMDAMPENLPDWDPQD